MDFCGFPKNKKSLAGFGEIINPYLSVISGSSLKVLLFVSKEIIENKTRRVIFLDDKVTVGLKNICSSLSMKPTEVLSCLEDLSNLGFLTKKENSPKIYFLKFQNGTVLKVNLDEIKKANDIISKFRESVYQKLRIKPYVKKIVASVLIRRFLQEHNEKDAEDLINFYIPSKECQEKGPQITICFSAFFLNRWLMYRKHSKDIYD